MNPHAKTRNRVLYQFFAPVFDKGKIEMLGINEDGGVNSSGPSLDTGSFFEKSTQSADSSELVKSITF